MPCGSNSRQRESDTEFTSGEFFDGNEPRFGRFRKVPRSDEKDGVGDEMIEGPTGKCREEVLVNGAESVGKERREMREVSRDLGHRKSPILANFPEIVDIGSGAEAIGDFKEDFRAKFRPIGFMVIHFLCETLRVGSVWGC